MIAIIKQLCAFDLKMFSVVIVSHAYHYAAFEIPLAFTKPAISVFGFLLYKIISISVFWEITWTMTTNDMIMLSRKLSSLRLVWFEHIYCGNFFICIFNLLAFSGDNILGGER